MAPAPVGLSLSPKAYVRRLLAEDRLLDDELSGVASLLSAAIHYVLMEQDNVAHISLLYINITH